MSDLVPRPPGAGMHGHGYAPPQPKRPPTALLIVLRTLFVALALLSFGFLAWATMLRIAIMRRRRLDWLLFWISLALIIASLVVIGSFGTEGEVSKGQEDEPRPIDFVALAVLLGLAIGVPTHYLVADIRYYQEPRPAWAQPPQAGSPYTVPTVPYGLPPQSTGYGYPPARPPQHGLPPVQPPAQPQPQRQPQPPVQPQPQRQPQQPPQPAPEKPRIDQVRAELDELSDYLRKEQGR
ncbi:hypothetical protein OG883_27940 [Streptomyces sp. NBC_01142]|uniref:hypothetical protein n=1 Tax=Streptomyces sp. NBC_01142 TaxID=2975865 RepID=UPI0022580A00|nr:hypothetical protein [Streptomyces sp. NBC_01142]MCX4823638.1 hypothetical protein [Streptomyces sp. NBC_01142]